MLLMNVLLYQFRLKVRYVDSPFYGSIVGRNWMSFSRVWPRLMPLGSRLLVITVLHSLKVINAVEEDNILRNMATICPSYSKPLNNSPLVRKQLYVRVRLRSLRNMPAQIITTKFCIALAKCRRKVKTF